MGTLPRTSEHSMVEEALAQSAAASYIWGGNGTITPLVYFSFLFDMLMKKFKFYVFLTTKTFITTLTVQIHHNVQNYPTFKDWST